MANIFCAVSKYAIIFLMAFYVLISYRALKKNTKQKKRSLYRKQNLILYIFHFLSFMVIYINVRADKLIIFYGLQLIYFVLFIELFKVLYPKVNRILLNNMCFLISIGFVILTRRSYTIAVRQFVFCVVASFVSMLVPWFLKKVKYLRRFYYLYGVLGLGVISLVFLIGETTYGAKISLDLGIITLQPSEFVKITFVLFISGILYKNKGFGNVIISGFLGAAHVIILVLSKDLGSALIFFVTYVFILFATTGKSRYLFAGLTVGCVAAFAAYKLFDHVQVRVAAWVDPWSIIDGKGYQITQSLFGIGTGGWFGMGLYKGNPGLIPVVDQDFIFSAISEELGGFFALMLILLYLNVFIIFIRVAFRCADEFYKTTAFGLAVVMAIQAFLTVGGAVKLIPSTGVTLPLISYGGSSIVATVLTFSIIQAFYINEGSKDSEKTMPVFNDSYMPETGKLVSLEEIRKSKGGKRNGK